MSKVFVLASLIGTFALAAPLRLHAGVALCGDKILDAGEECDDGNLSDGDGCSAKCTLEKPVCGDGVLDAGEECDDGNLSDGDGCSAKCTREVPSTCGDPRTQGFWKRVCAKPHPEQPDRSILSSVLCEDLNPKPTNSACEQARSQRAALILNVASDRVALDCTATITGGSIEDLIARIDALIAESTFEACKEAAGLAVSVNEGGVN